MEEDDDVIGLLNTIKGFAFATVNVQYPYWTGAEQFRRVAMVRMGQTEKLPIYHKRWMASVQVMETHFGPLIPTVISAQCKDDDTTANNKIKACLFLASVDSKRYGSVIDELNNQYLTGNMAYPESVEKMVNLLTHRSDHNSGGSRHDKRTKDEDDNNDNDGKRSQQYWQANENSKKQETTEEGTAEKTTTTKYNREKISIWG
jgi:hypothetical protein